MNDFNKKLKAINDLIEKLENDILKLEYDIRYMKEILKINKERKRRLLSSYRY